MNLSKEEFGEVSLYFHQIADSKPLSHEREVELAARVREGDMEARDELVGANLRFVVDVAKNFQNQGLSLLELISAGNLGLLVAAERFDGTKGYKFISYAVWWIRQAIFMALDEEVKTVRLPLNKMGLLRKISKVKRHLGQTHETNDIPLEMLAAETGESLEEIKATLNAAQRIKSLDAPVRVAKRGGNWEEGHLLGEILADPVSVSPEEKVNTDMTAEVVSKWLACLDKRERKVIGLYYGLDGGEPKTLEEIGSLVSVTRERVRQIKDLAIGRLRHASQWKFLRELCLATDFSSEAKHLRALLLGDIKPENRREDLLDDLSSATGRRIGDNALDYMVKVYSERFSVLGGSVVGLYLKGLDYAGIARELDITEGEVSECMIKFRKRLFRRVCLKLLEAFEAGGVEESSEDDSEDEQFGHTNGQGKTPAAYHWPAEKIAELNKQLLAQPPPKVIPDKKGFVVWLVPRLTTELGRPPRPDEVSAESNGWISEEEAFEIQKCLPSSQ